VADVYSIRAWNEHFEVSQSRKRKHALNWVALPTKHDGKSFRRLMMMSDGLEIYGAWVLLVQVAAKCPVRGILADADGPLDSADLAIKTGCRQELFDKALKILSAERIGWLVVAEWERTGTTVPLHTNNTNIPTNQPHTQNGGTAGGLAGIDCLTWGHVDDRLAGLKVSKWRQSRIAAQEAGCSPEMAMRLLDVAKANDYGPGAIVLRFGRAHPDLPVDEGWPVEPAKVQAAVSEPTPEDQRAYIVRGGRSAGWSKEQINAALSAKGLDVL
jgi:hypothetical protein